MAESWQDAVRPGLVRDLLRPTLLARDEQSELVGDLVARGAWPELRFPLLAAWTHQWNQDQDGAPESLPIVHPRAPEPSVQPVRTVIQVQATTVKQAPAAPPPAAPRVRARTSAPASPPARPRDPSPVSPEPAQLIHRTIVEHRDIAAEVARLDSPRADSPNLAPPPPRQPVDLPRVVAAFRPDLAARLGTPAPTPAAAPVTAPITTRDPAPSDRSPPERSPAVRSADVPTDMPRATGPVDPPRTAAHPTAEPPAPALVHPSQPGDPAAPSRPASAIAADVPATMSPRLAVAARPTAPLAGPDPQLVHPAPRSASAPSDTDLSEAPASSSAGPTPTPPLVATARPVDAPPRVRPAARPAARPRTEARWTDERGDLSRPHPSAAARPLRRDALPHPTPISPAVEPERRPAPAPAQQPVPSTTPAAAPVPAPVAPPLDIDALVETVERRLARGLERSRQLRRALR